jgi:hypothetical protein
VPVGKFVRVADVVTTARDERGLPILANIVLIGIASACESSRVTAVGCPCDENGVPGPLVVVPVEHWLRMAFPLASKKHPHATFWYQSGRIAYVDIAISVDEWLAYQADLVARRARLDRLLTTNRRARRRARTSPKADRIIHWLELHRQTALRGVPHALVLSWLRDIGPYGGLASGGKTRASKSYAYEIVSNWQTSQN